MIPPHLSAHHLYLPFLFPHCLGSLRPLSTSWTPAWPRSKYTDTRKRRLPPKASHLASRCSLEQLALTTSTTNSQPLPGLAATYILVSIFLIFTTATQGPPARHHSQKPAHAIFRPSSSRYALNVYNRLSSALRPGLQPIRPYMQLPSTVIIKIPPPRSSPLSALITFQNLTHIRIYLPSWPQFVKFSLIQSQTRFILCSQSHSAS